MSTAKNLTSTASKSYKTMTKKQQKSINAKKELMELSQAAKAIRAGRIKNAASPAEAIAAAEVTLNSIILEMYQAQTGVTEFKTFGDWKKAGYYVKKGESGFRFWSTPKQGKREIELTNVVTNESETKEENYEFWGTYCLFGAHQVAPFEEPEPTKDNVKMLKTTEKRDSETKTNHIDAWTRDDYDARIEDKKAYFRDKAEEENKTAQETYEKAREMASAIPFGQPILVGHHSERRDRNYRAKIHNTYGKAFSQFDKAKHYEDKAERLGSSGIASDDNNALQKLKRELEALEQAQETMKTANKQYKKGGREAVTVLTQEQIDQILDRPFLLGETRLFARYALTNNLANIKRVKQRIESLEAQYQLDPEIYEDEHLHAYVSDGRVCIDLKAGKPEKEISQFIAKVGRFNFSRQNLRWQRKATANAYHATKVLIPLLVKKFSQ